VRFVDEFDSFLENVVNLSPGRLARLEERVATIEKVLRNADDENLVVVDARPQGSLAQKTIINPKDEKRGFDADLLVECENRFETPKALLKTVKDILLANQRYADKIEPGHRCVTVQYAGEFHLDVVPCVRHNGQLYIANKDGDWPLSFGEKVGTWEATDPDGLSAWIGERDDHANGFLIPTIRLCKFLRDYKGRPKIKSVILTRLLADRIFRRQSAEFTDLPTTLVLVLEDLVAWCDTQPVAPTLYEPTCGAELRLDDTNWDAFCTQIRSLAKRSREAYDADSQEATLARWRDLFGKRFPAPADRQITATTLDEGEQDLFLDYEIPTEVTGLVTLETEVRKDGVNLGTIYANTPLEKGLDLYFRVASTTVPRPYDIYWKVKNSGREAMAAKALRGEINKAQDGPLPSKKESTAYTGSHYVEVYLVKDGVCVATTRHAVEIR
jgi:hypothetical protein